MPKVRFTGCSRFLSSLAGVMVLDTVDIGYDTSLDFHPVGTIIVCVVVVALSIAGVLWLRSIKRRKRSKASEDRTTQDDR